MIGDRAGCRRGSLDKNVTFCYKSAVLSRLRHARFIWLLPLLYLFGAGGAAHGFVLCLDEDHLAVELTHQPERFCAPHCAPGPAAADERARVITGADPHEGCLDLLLIGGHAQPVPVKIERKGCEAPAPPVLASVDMPRREAGLFTGQRGPTVVDSSAPRCAPLALQLLRTVILII